MLTKISTANMSREDWLAERRHSLGGSDMGAVLGLNRWSSPYSVWAEKTGRLPPKEDNEAMRQGRDLGSTWPPGLPRSPANRSSG